MYARKLWYGANDGDESHVFAALLELRRRKNGPPLKFVFYHYAVLTVYGAGGKASSRREIHMLTLPKCADAEDAVRRFSPRRKSFPGWPGHSEEGFTWEKTTDWLYPVSVGGTVRQFFDGTWVKVGTPNRWKLRHEKRKLHRVAATPSYVLRLRERLLDAAERELRFAEDDLHCAAHNIEVPVDEDFEPSDEQYEEYNQAKVTVENLRAKVDALAMPVMNLKDELRFVTARKLGKPYWPRGDDMLVKPRP